MKNTILTSLLVSFLALALSSHATRAQLPMARLDAVFPPGAQIGKPTDITLHGENLDELTRMLFTHPGISAKKTGVATFEVHVDQTTPPGAYETRTVGRFGISNSRRFVVGHRTELLETTPNRTPETAMELPLETVVNGHTDAEAFDWYRFNAKKGERCRIECVSEILDAPADMSFTVCDETGLEIARARNSATRDARLTFTAPQDGGFFVKVHDFLYGGNHRYVYRLLRSRSPHIAFTMPLAGPRQSSGYYTLYGDFLPGGKTDRDLGLQKLRVPIQLGLQNSAAPTQASASWFEGFRYGLPDSNAVVIGYANHPVALESQTDNAREIHSPVDLSGLLTAGEREDSYRLPAKKGDRLVVEVLSHRLGRLADLSLIIERLNDKGKPDQTLRGDDLKDAPLAHRVVFSSLDPLVEIKADRDAVYRVRVRDQFGSTGTRPYRLIVRKPKPDFAVVLHTRRHADENKQMQRAAPFLWRGGSVDFEAVVLRRDGFRGPVEIGVRGLPEGVHSSGTIVPADERRARLVIAAAPDAADWAGHVSVTGRAVLAGKPVEREAGLAALLWEVNDYDQERSARRLEKFTLAVGSAESPIIGISTPATTLKTTIGSKTEITLPIKASGKWKGGFNIKPVDLPGYDKPPSVAIDSKVSEARLTLDFTPTNENKFRPGDYMLHFQANGTAVYRTFPEALDRAVAEKKDLETRLAELQASLDKAKSEEKSHRETRAALDPLLAEQNVTEGEARKRKSEADALVSNAAKTTADLQKQVEQTTQQIANAENRRKQAEERSRARDIKVHAFSPGIRLHLDPPPPAPEKKDEAQPTDK